MSAADAQTHHSDAWTCAELEPEGILQDRVITVTEHWDGTRWGPDWIHGVTVPGGIFFFENKINMFNVY